MGSYVTNGVIDSNRSFPSVSIGIEIYIDLDNTAPPKYILIFEFEIRLVNGGVAFWISWDNFSKSLRVSSNLKPSLVYG